MKAKDVAKIISKGFVEGCDMKVTVMVTWDFDGIDNKGNILISNAQGDSVLNVKPEEIVDIKLER